MKKKLYILLISVLGLSIQSCSDYLDSDYIFRDRETIEKVFTDRDKTEAWLANAFSYLSDACADVCNKRVTPHCFADDMYTVMMTVPYKNPKRVNCHIMNLKKDCMMRILNKVCGKDVIRESDKLLFLFSMST